MSDETPKTRLQKLRLERDVKFDEIVSSKVFDWRAITGTDPPNINRIDRGVDPAFAEIPADDGAAGTKRRAGNRDLFADLDAAIDSEEILQSAQFREQTVIQDAFERTFVQDVFHLMPFGFGGNSQSSTNHRDRTCQSNRAVT